MLPPNVVKLRVSYGRPTGDEVAALFEQLGREIDEANDTAYAIPIRLKLSFSDTAKAGDIVLTKGLDVGETAVVVEKTVDIDRSHPHLEKDVVRELNAQLRTRLQSTEFETRIEPKGLTKPTIFVRYVPKRVGRNPNGIRFTCT